MNEKKEKLFIDKISKVDILILSIFGTLHSLFFISVPLFIILISFDINIKIVNYMAIIVASSFIIFRRCSANDIYDYIAKAIDVDLDTIPDIAKDFYMIKYFSSFIENYDKIPKVDIKGDGKKSFKKKKIRDLRLDILKNYKPLINCSSELEMEVLYNHRIRFILINIIVTTVLLYQFKLQKFLPLLLIWIMTVFKI